MANQSSPKNEPKNPEWHRVASAVFSFAAWVEGHCWVLRLNDFPEHPLFTLFIDGKVEGDLDDPPQAWQLQPSASIPVLDQDRRAEVLDLMRGLGPYGSEQGQPCDGDWCHCSALTDDYAARITLTK